MCFAILCRLSLFILKHILAATLDVAMVHWFKLLVMERSLQVRHVLERRTAAPACVTIPAVVVSRSIAVIKRLLAFLLSPSVSVSLCMQRMRCSINVPRSR